MKKSLNVVLNLVLMMIVIMFFVSQVKAGTINVGPSGDYSTIQAAINAATTGDEIIIAQGTYYENLVIDKEIKLIGENKNTTCINGTLSDDVILVLADEVTVSGFTISKGGGQKEECGIKIYSDNNYIVNNIIF